MIRCLCCFQVCGKAAQDDLAKKVKRKKEDRLPLSVSSVCFSDSDVQSSPRLHPLSTPFLLSQGPGLNTGALTSKLENLYVFKR